MDARTKEAIRYLGYGRHAVDDHTLKLSVTMRHVAGSSTAFLN